MGVASKIEPHSAPHGICVLTYVGAIEVARRAFAVTSLVGERRLVEWLTRMRHLLDVYAAVHAQWAAVATYDGDTGELLTWVERSPALRRALYN